MRKKQVFLKSLVAVLVLLSVLISVFLGTTNAEYLKSLVKKISVEAKPDLAFEYYLRDFVKYNNDPEGTTKEPAKYQSNTGVYKNAESFLQKIAVGRDTATKFTRTIQNETNKRFYTGANVVYQVKIPVDEAGYYSLNFTVDFLLGSHQDPGVYNLVADSLVSVGNKPLSYDHPEGTAETSRFDDSFFSVTYQKAVGCEILTASDGIAFGSNTPLRLKYRTSAYDEETTSTGYTGKDKEGNSDNKKKEPMFYSDSAVLGDSDTIKDSVYQWKTLTPSRQENVKLAFKATDDDVEKGYVIWAWDFEGLKGGHNYRLRIENLSVEKTMNLDGTTKSRTANDPYFLFPQTSFVNNQHYHYNANNNNVIGDNKNRASNVPGKTHSSAGRGTFVTEATANSLGMRAEMVYHDVYVNGNVTPKTTKWNEDNPIGLYIPLKNVQYNKTYKVTFDFSVARQGTLQGDELTNSLYNEDYNVFNENIIDYTDYDKDGNKSETIKNPYYGKNLYDYAGFADILYSAKNKVTPFQSYLYSGLSPQSSNAGHDALKKQITYANKLYDDVPLTKYDEVTMYNASQNTEFTAYPNYTTSTSVNDTYSIATLQGNKKYNNNKWYHHDSTQNRNFFNAVQHTEDNGQVSINWITFYNTTFSFNIPEESNDIDLNNLYWIWQIDALVYTGYYNLRIDNVRIQEVVEYTSSIPSNSMGGIKVGGTVMNPEAHAKYYGKNIKTESGQSTTGDHSLFNGYKGWNSTGQNYQSRAYDTFTTKQVKINTTTGEPSSSGSEVTMTYYTPSKYMVNGNIYAPIVDAQKVAAAPGGGEGADDYKIALSGWAVLKGGVKKYMWSADGGVTWHDMLFTGTSDTSVLANAENGIDQTTVGQSPNQTGGADHITFTSQDAKNNSFVGYKLVADLSKTEYKHQHDLDIIIAAVPVENVDLRCEIVRIINYHTTNHYVSKIEKISSDIITSDAEISKVTADFAITSGTSYNSETWYTHHYPVSERGVFSHSTACTTRLDYSNLQTTFSDIPVKTTLTVSGGIVCHSGVSGYYYSVDGGKSWQPCTQDAKADLEYVLNEYDAKGNITKVNFDEPYEQLLYKWVTRSTENDDHYFTGANGNFHNSNTKLKINLSAYEGQVVDVIVAAKPRFQTASTDKSQLTDIYLPVAKIDNVGVYGENGTFFSRVRRVYLDRDVSSRSVPDPTPIDPVTDLKFNSLAKWGFNPNNDFTNNYTVYETQNVNVANSRLYNNTVNEMLSGGKVSIDGFVMCKGGVKRYKFSLDGGETWTVINDNGNDILYTNQSMRVISAQCDNDFLETYTKNSKDYLTHGKNGSFYSADIAKKGTKAYVDSSNPYPETYEDTHPYFVNVLEFNLPALPAGSQRNLLVVAESTYGKLVPILHIKLKFKYNNNVASQYGYYRDKDLSSGSGVEKAGWISSGNQVWEFKPTRFNNYGEFNSSGAYDKTIITDNKSFNRMTIPINCDPGIYDFNLTHEISNPAINVTHTGKQLYKADGTTKQGRANIKLQIPKTHFVQGEDIPVTYNLAYSSGSTGFGDSIVLSIVSAEWKNAYDNKFAIWGISGIKDTIGDGDIKIDDIKDKDTDGKSNAGIPQHLKDLPAGKYYIYLINHADTIATAEANKAAYMLAEATIYIHSEDELVNLSVIHDSGEETCFSDTKTKFYPYEEQDSRVDESYEFNPFIGSATKQISIPNIEITADDVKRGYIVLDADYSTLGYQPQKPASITVKATTANGLENDQKHTRIEYNITYNITLTLGTTCLVKHDE